MNKKLTGQTSLPKNVIKKEVFDRETKLCRQLAKENKGHCNWGKCQDCGVVPLLYKFYKGQLLEKEKDINQVKSKILK